MTINEQHLRIYKVLVHKLKQFIEAFDILSSGLMLSNVISHKYGSL